MWNHRRKERTGDTSLQFLNWLREGPPSRWLCPLPHWSPMAALSLHLHSLHMLSCACHRASKSPLTLAILAHIDQVLMVCEHYAKSCSTAPPWSPVRTMRRLVPSHFLPWWGNRSDHLPETTGLVRGGSQHEPTTSWHESVLSVLPYPPLWCSGDKSAKNTRDLKALQKTVEGFAALGLHGLCSPQ